MVEESGDDDTKFGRYAAANSSAVRDFPVPEGPTKLRANGLSCFHSRRTERVVSSADDKERCLKAAANAAPGSLEAMQVGFVEAAPKKKIAAVIRVRVG